MYVASIRLRARPLLLLLLLGLLAGCARHTPRYVTYSTNSMATVVRVIVPQGPRARSEAQAVFGVFHRVDARMSEWKPTSPLSAVNRDAGGPPVPVPADLREVLHRGQQVSRLTNGAFDLTWAALWGLWNFNSPDPHLPNPRAVARQAALVNYHDLVIDDLHGTVRLTRRGMKLGLGGIAKGWALARSAAVLRHMGVKSFLLVGGGQVMVWGRHGDRPWRVGLRDPRGPRDDYFASMDLDDESMSTSGDYERYFIIKGVRYHHILNPRTGWPSRGLRSATVISPDATFADAMSTACMVMGRKRSLAVVEKLPGVEAVLVDDHGKVWMTPGLKDKLVIRHQPRP